MRFADCRESLTWRTLSEQDHLVRTCLSDNPILFSVCESYSCHLFRRASVLCLFISRAWFSELCSPSFSTSISCRRCTSLTLSDSLVEYIIPSLHNSLAALMGHDCPYPSRGVSFFSTLRPHHRLVNVVVGFLCCRICSFTVMDHRAYRLSSCSRLYLHVPPLSLVCCLLCSFEFVLLWKALKRFS